MKTSFSKIVKIPQKASSASLSRAQNEHTFRLRFQIGHEVILTPALLIPSLEREISQLQQDINGIKQDLENFEQVKKNQSLAKNLSAITAIPIRQRSFR
ncbi:MAG: hypothetical protein ACOH2B_09940 [Burkholderiaceae bacterium]